MKTLAYTLTFLTPAFLGGAEQSGRWRTPPVNNLDAEEAREPLP
jgi:CRISPR-associated protein Cmr1